MKKLLLAAMLLIGMSILISCNKQNDISSSIVGTWKLIEERNNPPFQEEYRVFTQYSTYRYLIKNGEKVQPEPEMEYSIREDCLWVFGMKVARIISINKKEAIVERLDTSQSFEQKWERQ